MYKQNKRREKGREEQRKIKEGKEGKSQQQQNSIPAVL
jgi:hypothetical protein